MSRSSLSSFLAFDWPDDDDDNDDGFRDAPPTKKAKKATGKRFKCVSSNDLEKLVQAKAPKTTEYATKWAVKNFSDWAKQRNTDNPDTPVPTTLLRDRNAEELNKWLSYYVAETMKALKCKTLAAIILMH